MGGRVAIGMVAGLVRRTQRSRLKHLAEVERSVTANLLRHLVEYDRRHLYIADGFHNLWEYCLKVFRLSESEIGLRLQVVKAIKSHPELLAAFERREMTLSAIGRLAPHLTEENKEQLIESAKGKTRAEVEALVADVTVKAAIQVCRTEEALLGAQSPSLFEAGPVEQSSEPTRAQCAQWARERNPDSITPVSADDWKVSFVASTQIIQWLEQGRMLLAAQCPEARLEDVFGALLELFLQKADPARRAAR
ncbi:MAG: hypothetical protein V2A73_04880, partial [Pseudomonadota bacterium]